jgi:cell division protein FtsB
MNVSGSASRNTLWRWGLAAVLAGLLLWVAFFDSHSLLQRYRWHQEHEALASENEELREAIQDLQERIDEPLPDSAVERIAREQYGMKRPGEQVYQLKER